MRENDPGEAEGGGGRLLPPLPGEWRSAAAAPQPIKSGGDVGTGVQSLAVPCCALRAVPVPWGHALRASPDHHVHPIIARQHPVKRCEQEVITPRLKVLPFLPPCPFPPRGIWGARLFATIPSFPKDAQLCSHQQLRGRGDG